MAIRHPIDYNPAKNLGMYVVPEKKRGTWEKLFGKEKTEKMKKNHSRIFSGNTYGAFKRSEETKKKMSKAAYKRWANPEFKRKMSYRWITNGVKTIRISVNESPPEGWRYGRS